MKATELRIGNWVKWNYEERSDGNAYPVEFGYELDDIKNNPNIVKPIPLTEEWLVKFGFEYKDGYLTLELGYFSGSNFIYWIGDVLNLFCKSGMMLTNNIKYVHQLQNLYFALTGEELKIK